MHEAASSSDPVSNTTVTHDILHHVLFSNYNWNMLFGIYREFIQREKASALGAWLCASNNWYLSSDRRVCRWLLKYICFYNIIWYFFSFCFAIPGEHPAAMQHNLAAASHSMSPALFLVSCIGALWTFTAISSSSTDWMLSCCCPPLAGCRRFVGAALLVGGVVGIYQRRWLNGELWRKFTREMTSIRRRLSARRTSSSSSSTRTIKTPTINSSSICSSRMTTTSNRWEFSHLRGCTIVCH